MREMLIGVLYYEYGNLRSPETIEEMAARICIRWELVLGKILPLTTMMFLFQELDVMEVSLKLAQELNNYGTIVMSPRGRLFPPD